MEWQIQQRVIIALWDFSGQYGHHHLEPSTGARWSGLHLASCNTVRKVEPSRLITLYNTNVISSYEIKYNAFSVRCGQSVNHLSRLTFLGKTARGHSLVYHWLSLQHINQVCCTVPPIFFSIFQGTRSTSSRTSKTPNTSAHCDVIWQQFG